MTSEVEQLAAIATDPVAFYESVMDRVEPVPLSTAVQLALVRALPESIGYMLEETGPVPFEVKLAAVETNPYLISSLFYDGGDERLQLAAVRKDGRAIRSVITYAAVCGTPVRETVKHAAVQQNPEALQIMAECGGAPPPTQ